MLCPLKFGHYEFEDGQGCIGSECGMHKLCGANDTLAAENDVSSASVDANDVNAMQDSREKLEEYIRWRFPVLEELVIECIDRQAAITERELCKQCSWPSLAAMPDKEAYDRIDELQKQVNELTVEREVLNACVEDLNVDCSELQKQVDELTRENAKLSSDELHLRQALASAEYDNATLRDKLGRMLDNAHEITRIGGDC